MIGNIGRARGRGWGRAGEVCLGRSLEHEEEHWQRDSQLPGSEAGKGLDWMQEPMVGL